jgi:hypothetical protein
VPTTKGKELVAWVEKAGCQVLLAPDLTGEWEQRIAQVQAGSYAPERLQEEMERLTREIVGGVARLPVAPRATRGTARDGAVGVTARGAGAQAEPPGVSGAAGDDRAAYFPGAAGEGDAGALPPVAGPCPFCGRPVIRGSRDWTCVNHDCTLRIPRYLCGHVLLESEVNALITRQRTPLITNFTSKTGKPFAAYLILEQGKVGFEFQNRGPVKGKSTGRRRSRTAGAARAKVAQADATAATPARRTRSKAATTAATPDRPARRKAAATPATGGEQGGSPAAAKTRSRAAGTGPGRARRGS